MYGKIRISGNILVKTGMHIGGSGAFAAIGAVDSPIIRDARTNLPGGENYIFPPAVFKVLIFQ